VKSTAQFTENAVLDKSDLIAILSFVGSVLALFLKPPTRRGVPALVAAAGSQTD
jgi:hypothetical protein